MKKNAIQKRADIFPAKSDLVKLADELAKKANEENTRIAYSGDWGRFEAWCRAMNEIALPASEDTVRAYIAYLWECGRKPSTIRRAMSSIRQAHKLLKIENPFTKLALKTEEGIRRDLGTAPKQAQAITLEHLRRILGGIFPDVYGARDRALILTGWCAALRRSELIALNVEDLEENAQGLILTLRRSKTDPQKKGYKIGLPFLADEKLCPVRALRYWLSVAHIESGAIFRRIGMKGKNKFFGEAGERLTDQTINKIIKARVAAVGYDPLNFSGHSLRAGFVTAASQASCMPYTIKKITGHRTTKTLEGYIRDVEIFEEHPLFKMIGKKEPD